MRFEIVTKCLPVVSVVIPARDEQGHIDACLSQLLKQTYPKELMEILVVDGMSTDGTRETVERFILANGGANVKLLDNPKGQRASALNTGIRDAAGEIIIRVDARTIVPRGYVEKCVRALLRSKADNAGGMQAPIVLKSTNPSKELTQRAVSIALAHPFGIGNAQFRLGGKSGYVDTVYLGCFRREIFDRVGLFNEDAPVISEDSDMNYRIRKAGGRVYFDKDIVAYYYPRDTIKDLAKLYFRYGGAKAGNLLKTKNLTAWRQCVPPLFLIAIIVLGLASIWLDWAEITLAGILGLYLLTDVLVSAKAAVKEKKRGIFHRLLAVFPALHFPWAMGFFVRLVQRPKPGSYWGY
ncbi:MAG: glycosyltransferase family 2 protein [Planctomycetota bacterium]